MPGFLTHYFFGKTTYSNINSLRTREVISASTGAYHLGLQGPDIFFYFLPSYCLHGSNIGSVAHESLTSSFYENLIKSRDLFVTPRAQRIAEAYIFGFLGHYCLDTTCHPYVYGRTKFSHKNQEYYSRHMTLETDIDKEMLFRYTGLKPSQFRQADTIKMSSMEQKVVATVLYYTFRKTYPQYINSYFMMRCAIGSIRLGLDLLRDKSGHKKRFLRNLERKVTVFACLSTMIGSDQITYYLDPCNSKHKEWTSPFTPYQVRDESMYDLIHQAQKKYLILLRDAGKLFALSKDSLDSEALQLLLQEIGNNSYHSGLPLSV